VADNGRLEARRVVVDRASFLVGVASSLHFFLEPGELIPRCCGWGGIISLAALLRLSACCLSSPSSLCACEEMNNADFQRLVASSGANVTKVGGAVGGPKRFDLKDVAAFDIANKKSAQRREMTAKARPSRGSQYDDSTPDQAAAPAEGQHSTCWHCSRFPSPWLAALQPCASRVTASLRQRI